MASLLPLLAASACARGEPEMLRDRAAERLTCPADQLEIVQHGVRDDGAREYAVTGCDRKVIYRCGDSMDQIAARDRTTGSDVRSQTRCEPLAER